MYEIVPCPDGDPRCPGHRVIMVVAPTLLVAAVMPMMYTNRTLKN